MERVCRYCPAPITSPHPKVTRCGAAECKRAWKRDYMREYQRDRRAACAGRGGSYGVQWRTRRSNSHCVGCGALVRHGASQETRCRKCHHPRTPRVIRAQKKLNRAALGSRGKVTWTAGRCARCGEMFVIQWPTRHCSKICARKDRAAVRRAMTAGAKVTPGRRYEVFERDAWVCRICGDLTNPEAVVPALDAPVVDHIVPLAQGGVHGPENWQTAHFYCNSVKRDQLGFDFAEEVAA